ncbi:MAG: radical SAM protein [Candidatus Omnitrophota bacterium]
MNDILLSVQKPGRYIGNEYNAAKKDPMKAGLKFALCFPDAYEIGMSHLGTKIIYSILNSQKDILCERVFAPWPDMETLMREKGILLASLENKIPLKDFDIVGFSLGYELSYTNVINMLELSGVPILRHERSDNEPIVIAGGICCLNPEPMSDVFDAFLIGEGEEAILEITKASLGYRGQGTGAKGKTLKELARIEGVYVPGISGKVKRRIVEDLNSAYFPTDFIVPNIEIVHDRVAVEIMRGCPFNCKFCQANIGYYPKRVRSSENIIKLALEGIKNTGYEEVSLLSLSSASHPRLADILRELSDNFKGRGVSISLPSLRVDELVKELPSLLARTKKTGLTIAPEAGTERLRNIINKKIDIDELYKSFSSALKNGWRRIKLYFMIGLPREEYSDLDGVADIVKGLLKEAARLNVFCEITLSVSSFVPKPHTYFEREAMNTPLELREKRNYLRDKLRMKNLKINFHNDMQGFLEAVLSRGDGAIGKVIRAAQRDGARFDAWTSEFKFDVWMRAFEKTTVEPSYYANRKIGAPERMPWDYIDMGLGALN